MRDVPAVHENVALGQGGMRAVRIPYHIKGGIILTGLQWSATQGDSNGFRVAYVLFLDGTQGAGLLNGSHTLRALCVRRSGE